MFLVGELLSPMGWSKTPPQAMLDGAKIVFQTQGGLRLASYWIDAAMSTSAHGPSPRLLFGHIINYLMPGKVGGVVCPFSEHKTT